MDGRTGEALNISKPIPLPALNVNSLYQVLMTNYNTLPFAQAMVSHGRVELLAHPLSQKYLQMKWNSYGKYFHLANVLLYSIFLAFVTCFSSQLMKTENFDDDSSFLDIDSILAHTPETTLSQILLNKTSDSDHSVSIPLSYCIFICRFPSICRICL